MAFESLAEKLQSGLNRLKGKGKLTEKDVREAMREVKLALLEADVNYKVVKDFVNRVTERAVGSEVMESLTPGQQVVKIVNEELTALMGGGQSKLIYAGEPPTVFMMVGLQGSGKTTSSGKLAYQLKKQGKKPMLVALDIYRPAAIKQLQVLGEQIEVPVFDKGTQDPVKTVKNIKQEALRLGCDVLILDTAGRLHVDETLMAELENIKSIVKPNEILLVLDSMTGQDAVQVAESFDNKLGITGIVLTKLDSDSRGGAALSVKAVTGKPIKYAGMGEKIDNLEPFYPDRMASRILGMGDVLTFIDKAQEAIDTKKAKEFEKKMRTQTFTLDDFKEQLGQLRNMGPIDQLFGMIPGMNSKALKGLSIDEKDLVRVEAIIDSMTPKERQNPSIINGSRRKRIAMGSGTKVQDVNKLLKQFFDTQKMMKQFSGGGKKGKKKGKFDMSSFLR